MPDIDLNRLREDLIRDERDVPHVYQDSEGYWTIGVGRMVDIRRGGGLSPNERQFLLSNDITRVCIELDRGMPWWRGLTEAQQRALANMNFQLGLPKLLGFRKMLAALQAGDRDRAAAEAKDSLWYRQTPLRAARIAKMLKEG